MHKMGNRRATKGSAKDVVLLEKCLHILEKECGLCKKELDPVNERGGVILQL